MTFHMNPDFPRAMAQQVQDLKAALEGVTTSHSGQSIDTVKAALLTAWTNVGNGASISEPELTSIATLISAGMSVWLEDDGKIMAED